ncbi:MAG: PAS domain S-box protein, partial [Methylococcales bacterium]
MQLNLPPGSVLDALPSPLIILNNLGEIVYFNKAWLQFADINGLEIPGFGVGYDYLTYCEQTTIDQKQVLISAVKGIRSVISGELETFFCRYPYPCHAANAHEWFQMQVFPIVYEKYRYAILLYENSTGSKTSEQSLRNILENAPIGMAIVTLDGRFIEVNQALGEILGYEKAELLNLTCQQINHPDDINSDYELMQGLLQGRQNSYRIEKRFVRKDGQIVWVSLTSSILRETAAVQTYIIKQIQDIT